MVKENPQQIDQTILEALGLTPEDVEAHDRTTSEVVQEEYEEVAKRGQNYYKRVLKEAQGGFISQEPVSIGEGLKYGAFSLTDPRILLVREIPDAIFSRLQQFIRERPGQDTSKIEHAWRGFIFGFGLEAYNQKDFPTAVNAFDVITEGGIMNNPIAMNNFGEIVQLDKTSGVDIFRAIQARQNYRAAQSR